jgi:tRNA pseudouridine38-40 synthase
LYGDVAIRDISVVDDTFNARFCAKRKTYVYHVYVSPVRRPLFDDTHMQIYKMPDIAGMQKTANELFLGTHDFREFAAGAKRENTTRTIYEFKIEQTGDIEIVFTITGNGFLQRMVRMMVGFLLTGRRTAAPANGLTLWRVTY